MPFFYLNVCTTPLPESDKQTDRNHHSDIIVVKEGFKTQVAFSVANQVLLVYKQRSRNQNRPVVALSKLVVLTK